MAFLARVWPGLLATSIVLGLGGCGGSASGGDEVAVRVVGPANEARLAVVAAIADDEFERAAGLIGQEPLAGDRGLLIVFPVEDDVCIVNTGVSFAIDAVFSDSEGRVVAVERSIPAGDSRLRCHDDTRRILEVRAGVAATVARGDEVQVG